MKRRLTTNLFNNVVGYGGLLVHASIILVAFAPAIAHHDTAGGGAAIGGNTSIGVVLPIVVVVGLVMVGVGSGTGRNERRSRSVGSAGSVGIDPYVLSCGSHFRARTVNDFSPGLSLAGICPRRTPPEFRGESRRLRRRFTTAAYWTKNSASPFLSVGFLCRTGLSDNAFERRHIRCSMDYDSAGNEGGRSVYIEVFSQLFVKLQNSSGFDFLFFHRRQ